MVDTMLSYEQEDSVRLLCEIDLKKLFPTLKKEIGLIKSIMIFSSLTTAIKIYLGEKGICEDINQNSLFQLKLIIDHHFCLSLGTLPVIWLKKGFLFI